MSDEYEEGYAAYHNGLLLSDNPFPYPSWQHKDWDDGWIGAEWEDAQ